MTWPGIRLANLAILAIIRGVVWNSAFQFGDSGNCKGVNACLLWDDTTPPRLVEELSEQRQTPASKNFGFKNSFKSHFDLK